MRYLRARQRPSVHAFAHSDPRVVAKTPVQLASTDVEGDDAGRAAPEEDVGKATCRSADVERTAAGGIDVERVKRVRELETATTNVRMIRFEEGYLSVARNRRSDFGHDAAVNGHVSRQDERTCPLARLRKTLFDHK